MNPGEASPLRSLWNALFRGHGLLLVVGLLLFQLHAALVPEAQGARPEPRDAAAIEESLRRIRSRPTPIPVAYIVCSFDGQRAAKYAHDTAEADAKVYLAIRGRSRTEWIDEIYALAAAGGAEIVWDEPCDPAVP